MKLRKFIKGANFYFQMLDDNGLIVLQSQPYTSKEARDNGVASVKKNMRNAERYEVKEKDDRTYFILKASNGQEIGKSRNFESASARDQTMSYAQGGKTSKKANSDSPIPKAAVSSKPQDDGGEAYGTDGKTDDYKPLKYYEKNGGNTVNGFDTFSADNEHYFSYRLDGMIYIISEGYKSDKSRDNGIKSAEKNMIVEDRYQRQQHPNGKFFFNLKAGNNQEIATSRWFDEETEMNDIISRLLSGGLSEDAQPSAQQVASVSMADTTRTAVIEPQKKRKKKRTSKKPKAEKVYLAEGDYLHNDITYQLFRSGNDKHYFTFRNSEGKTILLNSNVRGFATQEEGQANLDEVFKHGPTASNYEGKTTKNGKYYFYLKDDEGKNIAKSFFFNTEEDMQVAIGSLCGPESASSSRKPSSGQQDSEAIGLAAMSDNIAVTESKESAKALEEAAARKAEEKAVAVSKASEEAAARKAEEAAAAASKASEEVAARKAEEATAAASKASEEVAARKAEEEAAAAEVPATDSTSGSSQKAFEYEGSEMSSETEHTDVPETKGGFKWWWVLLLILLILLLYYILR